MRTRQMTFGMIAAVALLMAGALAACGDAGDDDEGGDTPDVEAESDCDGKFDDGTRMAELADAGKINVGVRFDQPGLGFKGGTDDLPAGFDVEMAKLLVADLCIDPEDTDAVNYEETISDNREPYLQTGRVDLVRGVVLDHRRAPRARRPGRALLPHRPAGAGADRQRRRVDRGPRRARRSARPPARPRSRTSQRPERRGRARRHLQHLRRAGGSTARCRRCRPTVRSCSASPPSTTAS